MPSYLGEYCSDCGAGIRGVPRQILHDEFHQKMDELIEWAQHISELMEQKAQQIPVLATDEPKFCIPCEPPCCMTVEEYKKAVE